MYFVFSLIENELPVAAIYLSVAGSFLIPQNLRLCTRCSMRFRNTRASPREATRFGEKSGLCSWLMNCVRKISNIVRCHLKKRERTKNNRISTRRYTSPCANVRNAIYSPVMNTVYHEIAENANELHIFPTNGRLLHAQLAARHSKCA